MDHRRKRIRGKSPAARLRKVVPATKKHMSRVSLPILSVTASTSHSVLKSQGSCPEDCDSSNATCCEVVLSCTENQSEVTSLVEAGMTSSTISGLGMVPSNLELNIPTSKTEPCKFKANSVLEYEEPVKKLRISDTEYKQDLSVDGNIVGKSGLENENSLIPGNQGIFIESEFDQHSGSNNVTSVIKLDHEIADNKDGQHHENNLSVNLERLHYEDDNGISYVNLEEKNTKSTDGQHNEKDNEISSLLLVGKVADNTLDKHHENDTVSRNLVGRIADSTVEQHFEKDLEISSTMLYGQNADDTNSQHNDGIRISFTELSRKSAVISSCTLSSEIGHKISKEAEIIKKSQMLIKNKIKREENICNSDIVKEGVMRKQEVINTSSVKYIEDSVITEEKIHEKIENKSEDGSALALQIRETFCIKDTEMISRNAEDTGKASPCNDVNLKKNTPQTPKKPYVKKRPNIRLKSKVVNVLCNDAESTLKEERGAEGKENPLHLQKLTSITYPSCSFKKSKVLDIQPSSCRVTKAKKRLTRATIQDLSSSLCKISVEQDHKAIDTSSLRSEEQINSEGHNASTEMPDTACPSTSDDALQNQNADVYTKIEEVQDRSSWFVNHQRTVQTLPEREKEENIEVRKQSGLLFSECSRSKTQIIDEENNSHHIVVSDNVSLHGQDSDSKELSRDGHDLPNLIPQNSISVAEGFSCCENMGSTLLQKEFNTVEKTKSVMKEEIHNNGKDAEIKESVLNVQEINSDEKDGLDIKNLTTRTNLDCQWQDLNSVKEKIGSSDESHAEKKEKYSLRDFSTNEGGNSVKGFEFEGFVKDPNFEREMTETVKDNLCSEPVDCLVQKPTCKGAPESSYVKENTSNSLSESDITNISNWQVKMTSLLTISGALGCKKQLLIVPRSYLTVELVLAAISLGKFSHTDIHSWICKICRPVNRDFTEINRKQFMQYELLHRIISKTCSAKKRSHWEKVLKKSLYVLPKGGGWSLIFEKIPDICQNLGTSDAGFSNITKKKSVASCKKCRSNTAEAKLGLLVKKLRQKCTQVKVLRGKQMSAGRELKNIKEKLQEKINGIKAFIKIHGGKISDSCLKSSSSKNQTSEKNFISETEEVLANLYGLVEEKEVKNDELQQKVAELKVVIDEKDKVIQQKTELAFRTETKAIAPIESRCEKKQKDHVTHINHLQEKLRKIKELVSYKELCCSRLKEELRTQRQLLGEKDHMIARNEKKIADLKSDAVSCRSFHGELEHKLHIAHCSLQERDVYIRSLEDQYYGISHELKMANFNLQEKISVIQQQQNLLDQEKEKYHWSCINNQKNQGKQKGEESVSHYMEEYNKHLADLENRLIQCNNILSEKESFIKQLQKNFSDYQAFVKERESQLAVGRICQKCSEPANKFDWELPSSSLVQCSDEKNPTENELLARKDEKLRSAYKRMQELHGEVEYLVERTKAGSSTSDLKEMLEMKRKNAALQQCIITREEMNAQLEENLSVQNKALAYFKEQLQMKSTIIEYLQNFIIDKESITINTETESVGISGNINAENKSNGNCEKDKDRDFLGSGPVHSPQMTSSVEQVEGQSSYSNHENAKGNPQIGEHSKVQQGVLNTLKDMSAPDKNIVIYQNETDTETKSYCTYKEKEESFFEKVQVETRKTCQKNVIYSNEYMGSQKTMKLHGQSLSYSGVFTYEKCCNTTSESSNLMQVEGNVEGQKTNDFSSEHRKMNLEISFPEKSEQQFMNCDPKMGICDQADLRLQLSKCEQGRNFEAADGEGKTCEEKETKETEKPYPVKITYSEYCMRNKNKIFPLSVSNNSNEPGTGQERLHPSENISKESGWHGDYYSNITRERKHQNLEAGYGEMSRKRNFSKEMTLESDQTISKESKRSKFDVDKKGKVPVKDSAAKIPVRVPDEGKTNKCKISGNRQVRESKDPLEEIRKLKKIIEDLKFRNEKALTKEIARRLKVESVSRKREIILAQILDHNQKMKRQVKESDVALTLIERERERINQLLLENERALVEAARTKEKFSRSVEEKDKALENNQKELEDFKVDLKRKEETHEKEIEKYMGEVSSMEKEVGTLKLCLAKREELHEKDFAAANEILREKEKALENLQCEKKRICGKIRNKGEELLSMKKVIIKVRNSLIEQREELSVYQVEKSPGNEERINSLIETVTTEKGRSVCGEKYNAKALSLEEAINNLDCIMQDIKDQFASLEDELSKIDGYKFKLIQDMVGEKESLQNTLKLQQERLNETVAEHENCRTEIEILSDSLASEVEKSKKVLEEAQTKLERKEQEAEALTELKKQLEAELETNKKHCTLLIEKESYWKQQLSNAQNCIEELTAAKSFLAQQLQAIDISKEQLRKELKLGIPKQKVWNLDQELTKVSDFKRQLEEEKKKSLGVSRHLLEEKNRNKNLLRKLQRKNEKNTRDSDQPSRCTSESQTTSSLEEEMYTILENNRKVQLALEAERQVSEDFYKELLLEKRKNTFLNDCFKHECTESSKDMEHQLSFFAWMADKYRARMRRMDELSSTVQEFTENLGDQ
ncbi:uncharacterized protein [Penaeus vannamei]